MPVQLDRLQVADPELNRVQDRLVQKLNPVLLTPLLDGRLITGIVFAAGVAQDVAHGLGRKPLGYIQIGAYQVGGSPPMYDQREDLTSDQQKLFLRLVCAADATVDFWVF